MTLGKPVMLVALQKLQFVFSSALSFVVFILFLFGFLVWVSLLQISVIRTKRLLEEMSTNMATKKDLEASFKALSGVVRGAEQNTEKPVGA